MATLNEQLREAAARVLADGEVVFAYLFGSHADATATERSDIDIAVHLRASAELSEDEVLQLRLRLADELERAAGVGPIEVIVLDTAPLSLRGRVQETHTLLYSADEVARVRYESLTSRMYHDFKIHEQRSATERLAAIARRS